jgi:hypothetical protein
MIRACCTLCLLLYSLLNAYANNTERDKYIKLIQQTFDSEHLKMTYQYKLTIAGKTTKSSQNLQGVMMVNGELVYDSCNAYIQVRNQAYALQINKENKIVSVLNFDKYKKLTGIDPEKSKSALTVQLSMEAIDTATHFKVIKNQDHDMVEFSFAKQLYGFKYIKFKLVANKIKEIEMSMVMQEGGEQQAEIYTISMYNIKQTVNAALFDHTRFYKISNGKIIYNALYRHFQKYEVI